ncbi:MAG: hypothetical protein HYX29_01285 [Solirubrobacterales bacterium]|nr:hypothetical protein [Solirubrobacterales bacterium]
MADLIDELDAHSGAATVLLTAALIVVTIFYAIQNWRMAVEMRKTREAAILPKLALDFYRLAPVVVTTHVKNVGPGPAVDVDVQLTYVPLDGTIEPSNRRLRFAMLASGEGYDFMPPGELDGNMNSIPATYSAIELTGTLKDAAGRKHNVSERLDDLPEWRALLHEAVQRYEAPTPEKRMADALKQKFGGEIRDFQRSLDKLVSRVEALKPPSEPPESG